jgi:DNA-binding CsgD family transcriptional regulator
MNIESLFEQPALRRYWLLSKALESAPIDQALEIARAADVFLNGAAPTFSLPNLECAVRPSRAAVTLVSQVDVKILETQGNLSAGRTPTDADDPPNAEVLLGLAEAGLTTLVSTNRSLSTRGTLETVATLPGYRSGGRNLSPRETDMLRSLSCGNSNKLIARDLGITEATVKVHLRSLMRKIAVENRTQAALWAQNNGFAAPVPP